MKQKQTQYEPTELGLVLFELIRIPLTIALGILILAFRLLFRPLYSKNSKEEA